MFKKYIIALFFSVAVSGLMVVYPIKTIVLVITVISVYGIIKNNLFALSIVVLLPVFGQLLRFNLSFLGGGILGLDIICGVLVLIYLIQNKLNIQKIFSDYLFLPLLIFLLVALISLLIAAGNLSIKQFIVSLLYLVRLGIYFLVYFVSKEIQDKQFKFDLLMISGILISVLGFLQYNYYSNFLELGLYKEGWDPHISRLTSTWLDPNFVGGYLSVLFIMLVSYLLNIYKAINKTKLFLYIVSLPVFFVAILLTFSRSTYLSLSIGMLYVCFMQSRKLLVIMVLVGSIIFLSSNKLQNRINDAVISFRAVFTEKTLSLDPTAKLRVESWQHGLEIWGDSPILGVGYNTLRYENLKRGYAEYDKHSSGGFDSSLLTVLATTGLLGLIFYVWFFYRVLVVSIKTQSKHAIGVIASIICLMVHSLFVNSLLFPLILVPFMVLISFIADNKNSLNNISNDYNK